MPHTIVTLSLLAQPGEEGLAVITVRSSTVAIVAGVCGDTSRANWKGQHLLAILLR